MANENLTPSVYERLNCHDEERPFEEEERLLRELDCYHGFLPREDLPYLLETEGDFLFRVSETDEKNGPARREIILSVVAERPDTGEDPPQSQVDGGEDKKVRNLIVKRFKGKYFIEAALAFGTLGLLIHHYKTNDGKLIKEKNKAKDPNATVTMDQSVMQPAPGTRKRNEYIFRCRNGIKLKRWEFKHSQIEIGPLLGEGAYGEVRRGVLTRKEKKIKVAIKMTKCDGQMRKAKIREYMKEARIQRNLRHPNVVLLYGVAVEEQPLYIILELISGGSLLSYLLKNGDSVNSQEKVGMTLGAAKGLCYLHDKGIIHRDIAARNCLYTSSKKVKISDFGLSRKCEHYIATPGTTKLPIKWLAPETIVNLSFSFKTDVFSFGIMSYEIFANGSEPWEMQTNKQVKKYLFQGVFMEMPKSCPESYRKFVAEKVFVKNPHSRAPMKEVYRHAVLGRRKWQNFSNRLLR